MFEPGAPVMKVAYLRHQSRSQAHSRLNPVQI
jgi:hypothetical protein